MAKNSTPSELAPRSGGAMAGKVYGAAKRAASLSSRKNTSGSAWTASITARGAVMSGHSHPLPRGSRQAAGEAGEMLAGRALEA